MQRDYRLLRSIASADDLPLLVERQDLRGMHQSYIVRNPRLRRFLRPGELRSEPEREATGNHQEITSWRSHDVLFIRVERLDSQR